MDIIFQEQDRIGQQKTLSHHLCDVGYS